MDGTDSEGLGDSEGGGGDSKEGLSSGGSVVLVSSVCCADSAGVEGDCN